MTTKQQRKKPVPYLQTFGFREQMKAGQRIADALPKRMGLKETAKALGLTQTYVRRIECLALFKIQQRMKELRREAQLRAGLLDENEAI
jgi:hypothetical protein